MHPQTFSVDRNVTTRFEAVRTTVSFRIVVFCFRLLRGLSGSLSTFASDSPIDLWRPRQADQKELLLKPCRKEKQAASPIRYRKGLLKP